MVNFLRKKFIKDYDNINDSNVRVSHGKLAAVLGLISNCFLFIIKLTIGILTFSVSIVSDSINNLSDFASSIVTLVGFKMSEKPADKEHPYGHERSEYIAGLIVAFVIIFVGGTLFYSSLVKVINNPIEEFSYKLTIISLVILVISILVKLWQSLTYKKIARIIKSTALDAASKDASLDCISTSAVLIGMVVILISKLANFNIPFSIDGILGVLVSIFILISGIMLIKEEADPLLGQALSKKDYMDLISYIESFDIVLRTHDLICHNYGPTITYATIHVEFDSNIDIVLAHDEIDLIEESVKEKFGYFLTIHMDPIDVNDKEINQLKEELLNALKEFNPNIDCHDLRIRRRAKNRDIIFDLVVPYDCKYSKEEIYNKVDSLINSGKEIKDNIKITFDNEMFTD